MSLLKSYFETLLARVETDELIQNDGKDANGFYKPTRALLIRHLNLLKDLHDKPLAKEMLKDSWRFVVEALPPEWLVLTAEQKDALRKIL
jgi:hypothetical protein